MNLEELEMRMRNSKRALDEKMEVLLGYSSQLQVNRNEFDEEHLSKYIHDLSSALHDYEIIVDEYIQSRKEN